MRGHRVAAFIPVINRRVSIKIPVGDVKMIRRESRKITIYSDHGTYYTYIMTDGIERFLTESFVRCSCGRYVNVRKIAYMVDSRVCFDDGTSETLPRDSFIRVKQKFNYYLMELLGGEPQKNG